MQRKDFELAEKTPGFARTRSARWIVGIVCALGVSASDVNATDPVERGSHTTAAPTPVADVLEQVWQPVRDWLERANREYQTSVVKVLSVPTGKGVDLESAKAPVEPTLRPGVTGPAKGLPGIETGNAAPGAQREIASKDAGVRADALKRQIEARRQEQERLTEAARIAERQRVASEAMRLAETDALTRRSQKTAELARIAEEERRRGSQSAMVTAEAGRGDFAARERKAQETAAADKIASERRVAEKAAADKAAADKIASERRVAETAAADKAAADKIASERRVAETAAADKAAADRVASERRVAEKAAADKAAADKIASEREIAEKAAGERAAAVAAAAHAAFDSKLASQDGARRGAEPPAKSRKTAHAPDRAAKRIKVASGSRGRTEHGRCSRAGRDVDVPAIYVVKSGDTLWDISRRYYDKGIRFEKIVRANADQIASPDLIFPCQKVYLPGRAAFFLVVPMELRDAS